MFPSAWTERMLVGRNRSEARKRAPKGLTNSSRYSCLLAYSFEAIEWPSIHQTMSVAQVSGNGCGAVAPSLERLDHHLAVGFGLSVGCVRHFVVFRDRWDASGVQGCLWERHWWTSEMCCSWGGVSGAGEIHPWSTLRDLLRGGDRRVKDAVEPVVDRGGDLRPVGGDAVQVRPTLEREVVGLSRKRS